MNNLKSYLLESNNFLDNEFLDQYVKLIEKARSLNRKKSKDEYFESHHIIPRSFGGSDNSSNLVLLTAGEHLRCHLFLTECTVKTLLYKMVHALWRMMNSGVYEYDEDQYEKCKINHSKFSSIKSLNLIEKGIHPFQNPETKIKTALSSSKYHLEQAKNGNHVFQTEKFKSEVSARNIKQIENGTHPFQDPINIEKRKKSIIENNHQRFINGTHPFQRPDIKELNRERARIWFTNDNPGAKPENRKKISELQSKLGSENKLWQQQIKNRISYSKDQSDVYRVDFNDGKFEYYLGIKIIGITFKISPNTIVKALKNEPIKKGNMKGCSITKIDDQQIKEKLKISQKHPLDQEFQQ